MEQIPLSQYHRLIFLGIFAGLVGVLFNRTLLFSQDIFKNIKIKAVYKLIIIMLIAGIVGYFSYDLLGGGHHLIEEIVITKVPIKILIFYAIGKLLFTTLSYGSKSPGGIFLPILVLGGLVGSIYFLVLDSFLEISDIYYVNYIICGMAAIMTAVVRFPIISILLVSEMTGSFSHILALCIVSLVAYLVAESLKNKPIYHSLLSRFLGEDKSEQDIGEKTLINFKIPMFGQLVGKNLSNIEWPCEVLIVSIERDGHEIIPSGHDRLEAGDKIVVLLAYENISCITKYFQAD